jgi:hypothetical protein
MIPQKGAGETASRSVVTPLIAKALNGFAVWAVEVTV